MFRRPGRALPIDSWVFRPITIGWPMVTFLKCARSAGRRHGSALSRPITRLRAMATTSERRIGTLNRDRGANRRCRVVALEREILGAEREEVLHGGLQLYHRRPPRPTRKLAPGPLS